MFCDKDGNELPIGRIDVSTPFKHIRKAWNEGYNYFSAQGGTRSGKTVNFMIFFAHLSHSMAVKICVVRKTFPSLRNSILHDFTDVMKQLGVWNEDYYNKTEHTYIMPNGSEWWFVAADESEKLKGFKGDVMWLNEATEMTSDDFTQLNFRASRMVVMDYNPNFSDKHWLAKRVNDKLMEDGSYDVDDYTGCVDKVIEKDKRKSTYFFISTYKDNPFLGKRQVQVIEELKEANYTLWLQYGQGKRCLLQGRVFPNVNHIKELPSNRKIKWFVGIDYGYSNQPTAITKVGLLDKEMWIQEIAYQVDLRTDEIRKILQTDKRVKGLPVVADSANEMMNRDVEEARDGESRVKELSIKRVNKHGRNGEAARIDAVRVMQQYKINITEDSPHAIDEFESYVFKQDKDGTYTNDPVKFNDHCIDSVRYVIMTFGSRTYKKGIIIH